MLPLLVIVGNNPLTLLLKLVIVLLGIPVTPIVIAPSPLSIPMPLVTVRVPAVKPLLLLPISS